MNRCVVPLVPISRTFGKRFDVIIYNRTAAELMTVPNDVIEVLVRKYPDYQSSPFWVYDL